MNNRKTLSDQFKRLWDFSPTSMKKEYRLYKNNEIQRRMQLNI